MIYVCLGVVSYIDYTCNYVVSALLPLFSGPRSHEYSKLNNYITYNSQLYIYDRAIYQFPVQLVCITRTFMSVCIVVHVLTANPKKNEMNGVLTFSLPYMTEISVVIRQ